MVMSMYQLQIRIYQVSRGYKCYGELYEGEAETAGREPVATAHVERSFDSSESSHADMMWVSRLVCMEIAENLDASLF